MLAGLALTGTGQHELAIAKTEEVLALDPDATPTYVSRAFNQLYLNRLDDALLTVTRATERNLESGDLRLIPYFVAFLNGDDEELKRTATAARRPGSDDIISYLESLAVARSGRLHTRDGCPRFPSRSHSSRAGANGPACSKRPEPCGKRWNAAAARQSASKALALGRGRNVDYAAAFALALLGDPLQARALATTSILVAPASLDASAPYTPSTCAD